MPVTTEHASRNHGSWVPTLIVLTVLLMRWILLSPSDVAVSIRRWFGVQKVKWRKTLGLRDNKKYRMGAGDGANQRYSRQG